MQTTIINHYPSVIKQIKEIQQIAKAEDIEFSKLNGATEKVLNNMFVFMADETGVIRFETILGINNQLKDLKARKLQIIAKLCKRKMSLSDLKLLIENYVEGLEMRCNIDELEIKTEMGGMERDKLLAVIKILDDFIPLNIFCTINTREKVEGILCHGMCHQEAQKITVKERTEKNREANGRNYIGIYTRRVQRVSIYTKLEEEHV